MTVIIKALLLFSLLVYIVSMECSETSRHRLSIQMERSNINPSLSVKCSADYSPTTYSPRHSALIDHQPLYHPPPHRPQPNHQHLRPQQQLDLHQQPSLRQHPSHQPPGHLPRARQQPLKVQHEVRCRLNHLPHKQQLLHQRPLFFLIMGTQV